MLGDGYHKIPDGKLATVVTLLEMRERAPIRPVPAPQGVALLRMENPSLERYRNLYRDVGEDWLWFSRIFMPDADLAKIIHDPKVQLFTLEKDGKDLALLELDFRVDGECELAFFGLTNTLIGTGSGRYLMNAAIETAWAKPIRRFHVQTCTIDSPVALSFYKRGGFSAVGRKIEIADDPRLTKGWGETVAPHVPIIPR